MSGSVRLQGKSASAGMALGRAAVLPGLEEAVPRTTVPDPEAEIRRVARALETGRRQIEALLRRSGLVRELREIFEAQQMLLDDPLLREDVERRIREDRVNGEWALSRTVAYFKSQMAGRGDAFFQERLLDIDDVIGRVIANLLNVPDGDLRAPFVEGLPKNSILVADEIPPSLMLRLGANVVGIALEHGGLTGHTAILARNRGLPALVGVTGLMERMSASSARPMTAEGVDSLSRSSGGQTVLLDAGSGQLVLEPNDSERRRFDDYLATVAGPDLERSPVVLRDGTRIDFHANMDRRADCDDPRAAAVAGVGLFRTEFLYMSEPELLDSVEAQTDVYADILEAMNGRPVVFRLLDVGDDKSVFALGGLTGDGRAGVREAARLRGLAFLLAHPDLLEAQLKAIMRASARTAGVAGGGNTDSQESNCSIMLPMVRTLEEIKRFQELYARLADREKSGPGPQGDGGGAVPVGFMVETPAAALMTDALSRHAAFLSIGSNDLAQLVMPLDDRAAEISEDSFFEPAVLRMIAGISQRAGVPLALCGEIAAIPEMLPVLVGLGLRSFSLALPALADCMEALRVRDLAECEALARRVLEAETAGAVREILSDQA